MNAAPRPTRDIGDPITVELVDGPWLAALAADAKMLPIIDADRIEFGRALILQGYDASRALRMIQGEIEDNDGVLQMLARHRVAIGELAARYRAALEAIDKAVMDGQVCDDVAWFDKFTTLHDFIDETIRPSQPAAIGDLFPPLRDPDGWQPASTAPDGVDVLVWRQDRHRRDNLYGFREIAFYDQENDEWATNDGDIIEGVRLWCPVKEKPTSEQIAAITGSGQLQ